MYESFFNLKKKPFELVPDPDFIFLSRAHKRAVTYLDYGVRERAGFILLTGEVGSGKTTLIRDLLNKKYDKVVLAKLFNTRVTSDQLLAMINEDFGLPVTGKDKITLIRELNDFLVQQYAKGKQPILIIDEAQNLSADLLEEVRMLSNLETSQGKLLQIMLVGQPELRATLAAPQLLQLRQRISINCHLKALCREETAEYIEHRLAVAGNAKAIELCSASLDMIHQQSRGIPRLINIICDFIMLSAFAEDRKTVTAEMVADIIRELDFERHYWESQQEQRSQEKGTGSFSQKRCLSPSATTEVQLDHCEPQPDHLPELLQRLEKMEKEFERVPEALKQVSDTLVLLKQDINTRVDKCETLVGEMSGRIALAAGEGEMRELAPLPTTGAAGGFMRRLFRSAGPYGS